MRFTRASFSPSPGAEVAFAGTRDLVSLAAQRVDQTAEAPAMIVELMEHVAELPRQSWCRK